MDKPSIGVRLLSPFLLTAIMKMVVMTVITRTMIIQINSLLETDECLLDNNCKQLCVDQVASYTCACPDGFKLASDLVSCERKQKQSTAIAVYVL